MKSEESGRRNERTTMRSSRLLIRTTASLLRGPRCATSFSITSQYACLRPFSDEKKANNDDMTTTVTFDISTEDAQRSSTTTKEHTETLDRSEFTHEVPVSMPDMGEGKCKKLHDLWYTLSYYTILPCDRQYTA